MTVGNGKLPSLTETDEGGYMWAAVVEPPPTTEEEEEEESETAPTSVVQLGTTPPPPPHTTMSTRGPLYTTNTSLTISRNLPDI